jgi:hypothetical protein
MAVFDKLHDCGLMEMKTVGIAGTDQIREQASKLQSVTLKPVQLETTAGTCASVKQRMEDKLKDGKDTCERVGFMTAYVSRHDNMLGGYETGLRPLSWRRALTTRT